MPKKESLYEELCRAAKLSREDGESFEDFAARSVEKINKLSDPNWKALTEKLQIWNNEAQKAMEQKATIPELDGWPADEATEGEEEASEEEDAEETEATNDAETEAAADEEAPEEAAEEESVDSGADSGQEEESNEQDEPPARKRKASAKPAKAAAKPKISTAKSTKPGKAKDMATKTAPKAAAKKAAAPAAKKNGGGGHQDRIGSDQTIKVLVKENPHRSGTKLFNWFKKYKDGMTVAAATKAGIPLANIRYLRGLGHVKVV